MDCSLLPHQKTQSPQNFAAKTFTNSHKTVKFVKVSPSKLSRYRVNFYEWGDPSYRRTYNNLQNLLLWTECRWKRLKLENDRGGVGKCRIE